MNESKVLKFNVKKITFPRMDASFISMPTGDFGFSYRVEGHIPQPRVIQLLFGVRVESNDKIDAQTSKAAALVEVIGEFEFEEDLPVTTHISNLPLAGNLLALLYPFIREKIYSFFFANNLQVFLPPTNTISLVRENAANENFKVLDHRVTTP